MTNMIDIINMVIDISVDISIINSIHIINIIIIAHCLLLPPAQDPASAIARWGAPITLAVANTGLVSAQHIGVQQRRAVAIGKRSRQ